PEHETAPEDETDTLEHPTDHQAHPIFSSGAQASSSRFSPASGKRTTTSALSPAPSTDSTTPSPHLPWRTSSPDRRPRRSAPLGVGALGRRAASTMRSRLAAVPLAPNVRPFGSS